MVRQDDKTSSDNIVSLTHIRDLTAGSALAQIEAYWQTQRRGRLVPARSDIDPRGLTGVLEYAFVLERISSGLARFRVAGAHLRNLVGMEVRGMPLSALFTPEAREPLSDMISAAFDTPAIIRADIVSQGGFARAPMEGAMVLLPLRSDLGDITRILGGLSLSGEVGRTPRRLEIAHQSRNSLTGYAGPEVSTSNAFVATSPERDQPDTPDRPFGADADNVHVLFPERDT